MKNDIDVCEIEDEIDFNVKPNKQRAWIVSMLKKYFEVTGLSETGKRRFHYWLCSLPESERQKPSHENTTALYTNGGDYSNICCKKLTDALIYGEIDADQIIDEKNMEIFGDAPNRNGFISSDISLPRIPFLEIPEIKKIKYLA